MGGGTRTGEHSATARRGGKSTGACENTLRADKRAADREGIDTLEVVSGSVGVLASGGILPRSE